MALRRWGSITRRKKNGRWLSGYWVRYRRDDGTRTWASGGPTVADAEATLARLRLEVAGGSEDKSETATTTATERAAPEAKPTVPTDPGMRLVDFLNGDLARTGYLDALRDRLKDEETMEPRGGYFMSKTHLLAAAEFFGDKPMADIERKDIKDFLLHQGRLVPVGKGKKRRMKPKNGKNSRKKTFYSLSVAWKVAKSGKVIPYNPFDDDAEEGEFTAEQIIGKVIEKEVLPNGYIERLDMDRFFVAVQPEYRDFLRFLYLTGIRLGEGLNLAWRSVRSDLGQITITKSKSGATRHLPLRPEAKKILQRLRAGRKVRKMTGPDFVFPRLDKSNCLKRVRWASGKVFGYHLRTHDLRHLYATGLLLAGVRVPTVAELLGHSDGGVLVLRRYGRHMPNGAAEEAARLLDAFEAARAAAQGVPQAQTA